MCGQLASRYARDIRALRNSAAVGPPRRPEGSVAGSSSSPLDLVGVVQRHTSTRAISPTRFPRRGRSARPAADVSEMIHEVHHRALAPLSAIVDQKSGGEADRKGSVVSARQLRT